MNEAFEKYCAQSNLIFTDEDFKRRALFWFGEGQRHLPESVEAVLEAARKVELWHTGVIKSPYPDLKEAVYQELFDAIRNHNNGRT